MVSQAAEPLQNHPDVVRFFHETRNPLTGLLIGTALASLVHSSAIPISILVILAQHQLIDIERSLPIIFGANIGTAVTALLASFVANVNGKRSALSHLLFKIFGAAACFLLSPFIIDILKDVTDDHAQQIAFGHLIYNLLIAGVFIFLLKPFSYLIEYLIPGKANVLPIWPEFLDVRALVRPEEALDCVRKELRRELILAGSIFGQTIALVGNYNEGKRKDILYVEMIVDNLRNSVARYLWKISAGELSEELSKRLFCFSAMVDDIERIADHSVNILELCRHKDHRKVEFTQWAHEEIEEITALIDGSLADALSLLEKRDEQKIADIKRREDEMDRKVKEAREKHLERFHRRICQAEAGPIYVEMLVNLERISDHCENIAEYMAELNN
jgi:phosphate:Na+ symporter